MSLPFVIDNSTHRLADVLHDLIARSAGMPVDVATAYFNVGGYRLLREPLQKVGAFRLLLGSEPRAGADLGLRPDTAAIAARLQGDLEAEPFTEETLRLVEELIGFLRAGKVQVRLFDRGFLHAKAWLFHQDPVTEVNLGDRLRPFAAIVGSSNFTGPGLAGNRELNLVHRVILPDEQAVDREAADRARYLEHVHRPETILDPSGVDVPDEARRFIKSEVGARAVTDVMRWYEAQWNESVDFRDKLIDLLDSSKFGMKEYTPYQVYMKALYEYFRGELGDNSSELGRSAVDLAEFQEDAVRKARRILTRYDGVLIADSVGLGKTWIGKKLLEDFAYHRRQKAVVICPASLRDMWEAELKEATIAAEVVGMESLGRDGFDVGRYGDADVLLLDESHNFRNDRSNRYGALDDLVRRNGGRGRDGEWKKVILLSATPINNDLNDLASQLRLFTQNRADYFREAGIGDLDAYFRRARRLARQEGQSAGIVLFDLLEEIMVRNTRPYIRAAYSSATISGRPVVFPERRLHTVSYSMGETCGGLYNEIVSAIEGLSLAPYKLEDYRDADSIDDARTEEYNLERGREVALVGIFKTRFLKRLESSIEAFRLSVRRALIFEQTYRDYLFGKRVISSRDFHRAMRFLSRDEEDELGAGSLADDFDAVAEARAYIESLPTVDLNDYDLRRLSRDVEQDVKLLQNLHERTESLVENDGKLERLKELLATELKGQKVLIFSSFKDTTRYLYRRLTEDTSWLASSGEPLIRRIDSGNHPHERSRIVEQFAPQASGVSQPPLREIDILISTDVLSEGQNLQDCGAIINYDLTWNPIRLVQRNGRIDRIGSPHSEIVIHNMFPEDELENLLHLVDRLIGRIETIDDIGLLDASVLGEIVHPRTFNTIRRIHDEDGSVMDDEEGRAELAGPETLLKQLKDLLSRESSDSVEDLPKGIHSGLRREKCNGMFFYFQAPRSDGQGKRHYWRYIDAGTHEIRENRFEIAQLISCQPDEPRYIGRQDVFALQERVIEQILEADRQAVASSVTAANVDRIQQTVAETIKSLVRQRVIGKEEARDCVLFLNQPMGRALHAQLKSAYEDWKSSEDGAALASLVSSLADQYGKDQRASGPAKQLQREDLDLICYEYVTA